MCASGEVSSETVHMQNDIRGIGNFDDTCGIGKFDDTRVTALCL